MSFLPFISQYIVPALLSLYVSVSTFFPIHPVRLSGDSNNNKKVVIVEKVKKTSPTPPQNVIEELQTKSIASEENNSKEKIGSKDITPTASEVNQGITPTSQPKNLDNNAAQQVIPSIVITPSQTMNAKTTLHMSGKTINLSMTYPSIGGALSGHISGDCTGTLSGTYEGPTSEKFSGTGNAACPIGPISIPVTINFTGQLLTTSEASITYTIDAMGQTQKGTTTLTIFQ